MESFAERLKEKLSSSEQEGGGDGFDPQELMNIIGKYVKLESQKTAAVTTIQKMIKVSTEK